LGRFSVEEAKAFTGFSTSTVLRLCREGVYTSYKLAGARRITRESVKGYGEACLAQGPQFSPPPKSGKRGVGRPRTPKTKAAG
jgi:excisionase family DNA binding protein